MSLLFKHLRYNRSDSVWHLQSADPKLTVTHSYWKLNVLFKMGA